MQSESGFPPGAEPKRRKSIHLWVTDITAWVMSISPLALVLGVVGVILYGYSTKAGWVGVADKNFWDYLELLFVPAILAIGAFWLNAAQRAREQARQDAQRELEEYKQNQRIQDGALEVYLNEMSKLMIDHNLIDSDRGDPNRPAPLHVVARARTLTVLPRLDGSRKGHLVRFWYQAGLLTYLRNLSNFNDIEALHSHIDFDPPPLDLRGADLSEANLREAQLEGATLFFVNLQGTDLRGAKLGGVNLQGANLRSAALNGADLRGAALNGAQFITNEQLATQAASLERATMPNGQKYDEWLRDKEGSGEEGENTALPP
jgi:hypothetical protein